MMERWELPKGWEWKYVDDLFDLQQGASMSPRRRQGKNPQPFLRTKNILWGEVDVSDMEVMDFTEDEIERLKLQKGDLLVCEGGDVGRTAVWEGQLPLAMYQNHIHRLRRKSDDIEPKFYMYWMKFAYQVFKLYQGEESRTAIPNLSGGRLKNFLVPKTILAEQRRIVARLELLLGETRAMREDIQVMRRDLAQVMESALAEVFPNPNEEMPKGWGWKQIGEVAQDTERRNPSVRPNESFFYIDIAAIDNKNYCIRLEGVKEIQGKNAPSRARKVVHTNDIIFATTRPYLKNIAIVPQALDKQICSTGFCVLRAKPGMAIPKYLFFAVLTNSFIHQLTPKGANYPAVNDSDIYQAIIPIPYPNDPACSLAEQRRIVAYLEHIAEEIRAMDDVLAQDLRDIEVLEQSILAAAFRGEV